MDQGVDNEEHSFTDKENQTFGEKYQIIKEVKLSKKIS